MVPRDVAHCPWLLWHHTAGAKSQTVFDIDAEHRAIGDAMCAYNFVIDAAPVPSIWYCRPLDVVPAAAMGANPEGIHISCIGNFHTPDPGYNGPMSALQFEALEWLTIWLHHRLPQINRTIGHREVKEIRMKLDGISEQEAATLYATACPGDELFARLAGTKLKVAAAFARR